MFRLMCCVLMIGCTGPQIRPAKTAQSVATGERYKSREGFLADGGPNISVGPSLSTVVLTLLAVGGAIWAVTSWDQDVDATTPVDGPPPDDDVPLWARAAPLD